MALFDKMFGGDDRERKLKQEIKSLELRKESVFGAINGEITRLQRERSNVLLQAGTTAYETWCNDQTQADLSEFWNKMQELEKNIAEQETKKEEMGAKYDEEIKLINSDLGTNSGTDTMKCPNCGAAISQDDSFCQNCGSSLQQ